MGDGSTVSEEVGRNTCGLVKQLFGKIRFSKVISSGFSTNSRTNHTSEITMADQDQPIYSPFFGVMGATSAMVFSAMGAAYGTAKSGTGIAAMSVMRPELIMKSIIPVVMAGIIAIYGVVVAVLISGQLGEAPKYTLYKGFVHLGAGLAVGLSGLAAGYAIGIVGDAGVRGTAQQPRLFVGMILILIFAEVLGLYGLIVAIYLYTK